MHIDDYLQTLREGARTAAALADDPTREIAERLGIALEPSARLTLERALTDACDQISSQLAPASIGVRVRDGEISFDTARVRDASIEPTIPLPPPPPPPLPEDDSDGSTARFSLRIPQSLKDRLDAAADEQGVSTNVWITQQLTAVVDRPNPEPPSAAPRSGFGDVGRAVRGWVR